MKSILPATISEQFDICLDCKNSIIFREDLNPDLEDFDSIADLLHSDISQVCKPEKKTTLSKKILSEKMKNPTYESLSILKGISARFVGLASLYFPNSQFSNYQNAVTGQLQKLNTDVPHKLEKALLLTEQQTVAFNSYNFVATGFYGVGKTTVLEVAIDKIIKNPTKFPNAKIVFITWDESHDLKEFFQVKFQKIKEKNLCHLDQPDSLQVFSLKEACKTYQIEPMQSRWRAWLSSCMFSERTKVDVINDFCKKLQGEWNHILCNLYLLEIPGRNFKTHA